MLIVLWLFLLFLSSSLDRSFLLISWFYLVFLLDSFSLFFAYFGFFLFVCDYCKVQIYPSKSTAVYCKLIGIKFKHILKALHFYSLLHSLCFSLSGKLFIFPSILNDNLAGNSILYFRFLSFSALNISCHFLLASKVAFEKSVGSFMLFPLYVICSFSVTALNIVCLSLTFIILITMSWCGPLRVLLFWNTAFLEPGGLFPSLD